MGAGEVAFSDLTFRRRLMTLRSLDDLARARACARARASRWHCLVAAHCHLPASCPAARLVFASFLHDGIGGAGRRLRTCRPG